MKAICGARLGVLASATLLGLVLAAEARAEDGSASSGNAASAVDPLTEDGSADEQPPPEPPPAEPPPAEPPPAEPPPAEPPPAEPPPAEPPPAEPPPAEPPPAEPPPAEPPPPMAEVPPPEPPRAPPDPPVVEPPLPPEVPTAPGSQRDSIVTIPQYAAPPHLPLLFSTSGDGLAAVRVDTQSGPRSETRNEGPRAARSTGEAPLVPPLPFRDRGPSELYVSAGGMGSGSSGGFFPLVLAGLIALFAAAAQLRGGLVSLTFAPPRCTAFVLCLERPD
jgi:outer membrane biosynthesis protein TonB